VPTINTTGAFICYRIRDAIVLNLRRVFALDTEYPYVENIDHSVNFDQTKITINDVTPLDHFFYPNIVVSALQGEEMRVLQEDFISEKVNEDGSIKDVRGTPMAFIVSITAQGLDTITRDKLLDKIYQKFKLITDDLADRGVGIVKTSLESDRREFIQDRWIYTSGIRMSLYGEWTEEDVTTDVVGKLTGQISTETGQVKQEFRVL